MNNKRTNLYLYIIGMMGAAILVFFVALHFMLNNIHNFMSIDGFVVPFSLFVSLSAIASATAGFLFWKMNKEYKNQFEKYGIQFIKKNQKRESSALIMAMVGSLLLFPIFPLINAFLKSGLSKKQEDKAKMEIKIKRVDKFLEQEDVIKALENLPEIKQEIDMVNEIKKAEFDSVYNCNLYILKLLEQNEVPFTVKFSEKEVYYVGMNVSTN